MKLNPAGSAEQPQDELFEEAKALVIEMQTASICCNVVFRNRLQSGSSFSR